MPRLLSTDSKNLIASGKFVKDLNAVKSEEEYSADDFYYKAKSEIDNKNYLQNLSME